MRYSFSKVVSPALILIILTHILLFLIHQEFISFFFTQNEILYTNYDKIPSLGTGSLFFFAVFTQSIPLSSASQLPSPAALLLGHYSPRLRILLLDFLLTLNGSLPGRYAASPLILYSVKLLQHAYGSATRFQTRQPRTTGEGW